MVNIFFVILIVIGSVASYFLFPKYFSEEQMSLGFREAASPMMEKIVEFHDGILLPMCIGISLFVFVMIIYIGIRFSRKNNPKPATFSHNTTIEIIWTVIPCLILIAISIPSIKLLYYMDKAVDADMTLKVVGYQWYWGYEYPDHSNISFESSIVLEEDLKKGQMRLLETDNRVVLPVGKNIRILVTAADVIHAWAVPELGVKIDAVPGRLCSELCGKNHGYMPIVIEAVSEEKFNEWLISAKKEFTSKESEFSYKFSMVQ
jgi:cytochrome c oxidase subunit 2